MKNQEWDYKILGEGKETLIIEVGIGNSFYDWYPLVDKVKSDYTVFLYHRKGYGKSQLPLTPRTTRNIASELHELLKELGFKEQYIMLGHSFGGLCLQHYAKMFPDALKGLILVDSTSYNLKMLEDLDTPVINSKCSIDKMIDLTQMLSSKSREDLLKESANQIESYRKFVTEDELNGVKDFLSNPSLFSVVGEEFKNWIEDGNEIKQIKGFPDIPLYVIARDKELSIKNWMNNDIPESEARLHEEQWRDLQQELILLSKQGKLIIATGSDHMVHKDNPEVIIECLLSMVH